MTDKTPDLAEVRMKLSKARAWLLMDHPFFASLLLHMDLVRADDFVPTMATDGRKILFNSGYVMDRSQDELMGVLAHETLHAALVHTLRRGERDPFKWNLACDYVVNPIVIEGGLKLPEGCLLDDKYKGMIAEEVYNMLPDPIKIKLPKSLGGGMADPGGCGGVMDATNDKGEAPSKAERDQMEAEAKVQLAQAAAMAKARGNLPASIAAMVEEMLAPQVPWTDVLRQYLAKVVKSDYTWTRPNRRYILSGIILPTPLKTGCGEITIGIDTSGSIYADPEILSQFLGEVNSILQDVMPERVNIVYCDAAVAGTDTFESGDSISASRFKPVGGGGTAFEPVFDWVEENAPETVAIVYLTDLMGSFPKGCAYPTIWVCADQPEGEAPFGQTIHVDTKKGRK